MGRRPRPRRASSRWSSGRAGSAGGAPPGAGAGAGAGAYAAEGYDDVPRDEDYDPYAHGYAHGAGTREDPHNLRRRRRVFPRRRLGRRRRRVARGRRGFEYPPGKKPVPPRTMPRGSRGGTRGAPRAETAGGTSRWGQPTGRAGCRSVASPPGSSRAAAATPTSTSTRTTPTCATRRTTICSRTIRASRSRRLHPRAIGSRASAPAVRRRRRRRGLGRVANRGADTGGDTPRRLPRGAIDGPRLRATRLVISDPRSREVGFGNGFGYDADDLGDPSELDRDTIGYDVDDDPRKSGMAGWCSGMRTTARNLPIRSRARPGTRKNPRTRRVGG